MRILFLDQPAPGLITWCPIIPIVYSFIGSINYAMCSINTQDCTTKIGQRLTWNKYIHTMLIKHLLYLYSYL